MLNGLTCMRIRKEIEMEYDSINRGISAQLGSRIAEARKAKSMTQAELAKALDVHPVCLNRYERGVINVPYRLIGKVCETLGVDPNYLFGVGE